MIVAAVRDEEPRSYWLARAVFGVGATALIVFISGPPLLSWPLVVGVLVGLVIVRIANGEALLQISAEVTGTIRRAPRSIRSKRRGEQAMAVGVIDPGAWICHYDDYEDLRFRAQEDYRQRLEEHDLSEDDRLATARAEWEARKKSDAERGITYPASYQPFDLRRRPYYGRSDDPKKEFKFAVVAHRSDDGQSVTLGFLRGKNRPVRAEEKFYVRQARQRRSIETEQIHDAAAALPSLLEALAPGDLREDEIIIALEERHSRDAIRRATRGALATRLIKRRRDPARLLHELLCVFSLASNRAAERRREPKLTDLGQMWLDADHSAKEAAVRHAGAPHKKGDRMPNNEFIFYGGNFHNSPIGSTIHNGPYTEIQLDVSGILARTVETFESQRDRFRQTSDPEALEEAISEIRSTLEDGQSIDSRIMPALKVVTRIGEGLFLGVAGNALYSELLQLVELLSKK